MSLEHLYLVGTSLISVKLAKLKTYDCSNWSVTRNGDDQDLGKVLDCPELEALAIDCKEDEVPVLKCPKLRYLKCVQYGPWVSRLDSLEVLNLRELGTSSRGILSNHPKLHTLNVFCAEKTALEELVRSGQKLKREHLKIFVRSLPLDGELLEAFDEVFDKPKFWPCLGYFTAKGVELYAKHEQEFRDDFYAFNEYSAIGINKETFTNLKLLTDRTPIFKKIRRSHELWVKGLNSFSQDQLIELMKQMPNANWLTCDEVSLNQTFFDQLPTLLPHLYVLHIQNCSQVLNDLSFILRFPELWDFLGASNYEDSEENVRIRIAFGKKMAPDFGFKNVR